MKKLIHGISIFSLMAGSAMAADAVVTYDPIPATASAPQSFVWTGGYVGGQVGYGFGSADYAYDDSDYNYSNNPDGFIGGIYTGYNHQLSNGFVLGAEADIVWSNLKDSDQAPGDPNFSATTKIDWTGSARLRFGYALDRFMPYVTGGVAFGSFSFNEYDEGVLYGSASERLTGWTVGAGAEYALTDSWTMRGEYRYSDFGTKDFTTNADENYLGDIKIHDFRLGVAYKF